MSYITVNTEVVQAVMNNQGTQATSNELVALINAQGTQSTANLATAAKQDTSNALLTVIMNNTGTISGGTGGSGSNSTPAEIAIMNNTGTLATNATAVVIMNNQGSLATAVNQTSEIAALTTVVNNQGSQATSANQTAQLSLAQTGNAIATVVMNDQGTLATSAGQTSQTNALSSIVNNQGSQATAANQSTEITVLQAILNSQGSESTAGLATSNNQGTQATSALQTTGNTIAAAVMNNTGTLATAAGQTSQINALTSVVNNQGTQATATNQSSQISLAQTGNAIATVVMNDQGTLATSVKQDTGNAVLTAIMNNQGTTGPGGASTPAEIVIMNNTGTLATAAGQTTGNTILAAIMNNQGTGASATNVQIMNNQGTQATSALQTTGNTIASAIMNNEGTLATAANQTTQITVATAQMNNQGTQATAANQTTEITVLQAILNAQGTETTAGLATSANQTTQITVATAQMNNQGTEATSVLQTTGNTIATAIMNNEGTLATSTLQTTGNTIAQAVMNNEGTLATAANQSTNITVLQAILNAQGSESTAALTNVMNNQGTQATATNQTTEITVLQAILNAQGTESTTASTTTLAAIMNNQGTQATVAVWGTGTYRGSANALQQVSVDNGRLNVDCKFDDTPNMDAFSRLRVSQPSWRFDGQFTYQVNTDLWDTSSTSGNVTYDATNRLATMTNNSGTNVTVLQGHFHAPYSPGRSQLAFITFNMVAAPTSQVTKRVGYFDGNNGVFLEWDATNGISVNIASNTSNGNQQAKQANWNIDMLNGSGPSGLTLDLTKVQIFYVSLQALYSGRVICGFDINGVLVPVHAFTHANLIANPYIQQASLPVRYELRGTNSSSSTMNAICSSVISEGGVELIQIQGRQFSVNSTVVATPSTTRRPILTVRPKQVFNGVRNNAVGVPQTCSVFGQSSPFLVELVRNGTVTGPANTPFSDVSTADSTFEFNTNGTTISGGVTVYSEFINAAGAVHISSNDIYTGRLLLNYSHVLPVNPADAFSIVVTSTGSTAAFGALSWKEIR